MIESIKKDKWIKKVRKIFLVIIIVLLFGIGVYYGDINKKYVEIVEDMERYVASNVQNNTEIERVDLLINWQCFIKLLDIKLIVYI